MGCSVKGFITIFYNSEIFKVRPLDSVVTSFSADQETTGSIPVSTMELPSNVTPNLAVCGQVDMNPAVGWQAVVLNGLSRQYLFIYALTVETIIVNRRLVRSHPTGWKPQLR